MTGPEPNRWTEVDRFLDALIVRPDAALTSANADAAAAGLPAIQVSPPQGAFLGLLVAISGARSVLEVGTLGGYSTIWMARALPSGGRLLSLELESKHAEVARRNLARAGVADRVEIRVGPALASMRALAADPRAPFDFVFLDADKTEYVDYLSEALRLSHPGTVIVADNVVRQGSIVDARSNDPRVAGIRRFLERVGTTPELRATVLQTVGEKGYDGMAILRVAEGGASGARRSS